MSKQARSYFITPTRLKKYPHFYKNIQMIRTLNKNQNIVMPADTVEWLRGNWHSISLENMMMCIDEGINYGINWECNVKAAGDLFDVILKKSNCINVDTKTEVALASKLLREESFTSYISSIIPKVREDRRRTFIATASRNPSIKTYHVEMLWDLLPEVKAKNLEYIKYSNEKMFPDYILQDCVKLFLEEPDPFVRSYGLDKFLIEMVHRGMLSEKTPTTIKVPRESIPIFGKEPIVEKPVEKPVVESKSRNIIIVNI